MTHTQTTRTLDHSAARDSSALLAWICGGLALLLAAAGGYVGWTTYLEGAAAGPDTDTSLYGVGYVIAAFLGGLAAIAAIGAVTGSLVSRRRAGTGQVVLAVTLALAVLPFLYLVGILL